MSFDTDDSALFSAVSSVITPSSDVLIGTAFTIVTLVVGVSTGGMLRAFLGLVLVLFLQGYAVVAALLPQRPDTTERWVVRRVALPSGVSFVLLPLSGLALAQFDFSFAVTNVLGIASGITITGLLIAGRRRVSLPRDQRGDIPVRKWIDGLVTPLFTGSPTANIINAITIVAVATAIAALVFAIVAPAPSPTYASFSVLTENESGEMVASGYPSNMTAGESEDLIVEIENQGPDERSFTVVAQLQRFDREDGTISERSELRQFSQSVGAGETWNGSVTVTPDMTGQEMRLVFLLYPDDAPENPTTDSAEEHLFIWVDVGDSGPAIDSGPTTTPSSVGTLAVDMPVDRTPGTPILTGVPILG